MAYPNMYPPGETGRLTDVGMVPQNCINGHRWEAPMYTELGGCFYYDEETGPVCPECQSPSICIKDIVNGLQKLVKSILDAQKAAFNSKSREVPYKPHWIEIVRQANNLKHEVPE